MNGTTTTTLNPKQSLNLASGAQVTVTNASPQQGSFEIGETLFSAIVPLAAGASVTFNVALGPGAISNDGSVPLTVSTQSTPVKK